jgi:putative hydrolase of the HAD superfamily
MKVKLTNLEAVIFDLGGVILNIDYQKTAESFKKLGIDNFDAMYSQAKQSKLFDLLETGKIEDQAFRNEVRRLSGLQLSDKAINDAWNAMLLDLPKHRIEVLEKVKEKCNTFLLSNTNAIHYQAYINQMIQQFGYNVLHEKIGKCYFSHEIQLRKPNRNIFEFVIQENNLNPEKTLFIDDTFQHIEGAKKCNLQTLHLQQGMDIQSIFEF